MNDLTWQQVIARRLARSHLLEPAPRARLVDVVRDVGLIQAQMLSAAELGVCIRLRDVTAADVRRELYERRTLVKTWSLRGTLHLVPADELALWAAAARGPDAAPVDPALAEGIVEALDGRTLTRAELADAVGEDALRSPWGELLGPLALRAVICFGKPRGASPTFVRVDQWLGPQHDVDPDEARREVLRRYLRAYGPAKPADFQRWSGFGREASRELFAELELVQVRVEGSRSWLLADDAGDFDRDATTIRLLPRYDAYVIGFRPREPILPDEVNARVKEDSKGRYESVTGMSPVVVDGVLRGFWRRSGTDVEVELVQPLPKGRRGELEAAVERVRSV